MFFGVCRASASFMQRQPNWPLPLRHGYHWYKVDDMTGKISMFRWLEAARWLNQGHYPPAFAAAIVRSFQNQFDFESTRPWQLSRINPWLMTLQLTSWHLQSLRRKISPSTLPSKRHSAAGMRTQAIQVGVDLPVLFWFVEPPKRPFLQPTDCNAQFVLNNVNPSQEDRLPFVRPGSLVPKITLICSCWNIPSARTLWLFSWPTASASAWRSVCKSIRMGGARWIFVGLWHTMTMNSNWWSLN